MRVRFLFVFIVLAAVTARAQLVRYGDLFVTPQCRLEPCPAAIYVYSQDLALKFEILTGTYYPETVATAPDGAIVIGDGFDGLGRYDRRGESVGRYSVSRPLTDLTFDRSGFGYGASSTSLLKFGPEGVVDEIAVGTYPLRAIDLAADQCTLFYTIENAGLPSSLHRYDICARTPLDDFPTGPIQNVRAFRLLRDGTVLACGDSLYRFAADGSILGRLYPGGTRLSVTPDGKQVWVLADLLERVDIESMTVIEASSFPYAFHSVYAEARASYEVAGRKRLTRRR